VTALLQEAVRAGTPAMRARARRILTRGRVVNPSEAKG
jgi:hypothetical protein